MDGTTVHGWMAALGLSRLLAQEWPDVTLRWDEHARPVWEDGPSGVDDAVGVVRARSLDVLGAGQVLPGLDAGTLTVDGSQGSGRGARPEVLAQREWTGPDADTWRCSLMTAWCGELHPLFRLHAAQTLHSVLAAPGRLLRDEPELLRSAVTGLGMTERYPGGLWMLRHEVNGADAPDGKPASRASPGRDWLALMALPWMPPAETIGERGAETTRALAAGWWVRRVWARRYGRDARGRDTLLERRRLPGQVGLMYGWRPWRSPVKASVIPYLLDQQAKHKIRDHAVQREFKGPHDPMMLRPDPLVDHPDRRGGFATPDPVDKLAEQAKGQA